MQARALEEAIALARFDAKLHGLAVAIDRDRHVDTGLALRPDAAEETGEIVDVLATDREHDVAGADVGLLGRAAIGEPDDDQAVFHFGGVKTEPRPWRHVAASEFEQIV